MNTEKLEMLVEEINEYAIGVREYALSDDSGHAEFCQTFGYGDSEAEISRLDDEVKAKVEKLRGLSSGRRDFNDRLAECCNLELTGIYTWSNEVYSINVGEVEEQLPNELSDKLKTLSDEEFKWVRRQVDECYISDSKYTSREWIYINCEYDRFVMILDEEKLDEALAELTESA